MLERPLALTLLVVATLQLSGTAVSVQKADSLHWMLFESFMTNHSRTYRNDTELSYRFQVFKQSLERQRQLNAHEAEHGGTAVYGINKFSDLTPDEFKDMYLSGIVQSKKVHSGQPNRSQSARDLPPKFDWSTKNVIGPILDQQKCGSCWAFAVVETIASAYAIESGGHLYQLSPQQLISCDYYPTIALDGCRGGSLKEAFSTTATNETVIVLESDYPFASKNGETLPCRQPLPRKGLQLLMYNYKNYMEEEDMRDMLVKISPLTTSVNAITWQDYIGGIIQHHCSGDFYDHAIQIIGYDLTGDVPYWRIRNTWGTDWGENGFVRVLYGNKMCGLNIEVTSVAKVNSVNL